MFSGQVANLSAGGELGQGAVTKTAVIETVVDGPFMRRLQLLGKSARGFSARQVAGCFGVTRATFKAWETGKKSITDENARRARTLYLEWAADVKNERAHARGLGVLTVTFKRGVDSRMRSLEILFKPRKCDGCGRWFVPVSSRQKRHNVAGCRMMAARKARRSK